MTRWLNRVVVVVFVVCAFALQFESAQATECSDWRLLTPWPTAQDLNDVEWLDGVWLAVGDRGTMVTSTDRTTWDLIATESDSDIVSLTVFDGQFVAMTSDGQVLIGDPDSGFETASVGAVGAVFSSIAASVDTLVAVGEQSSMATSVDGRTWQLVDLDGDFNFESIDWTGSHWVALTDQRSALISSGGELWTEVELPRSGMQDLAVNDLGEIVAVSISGSVLVSNDAESWYQVTAANVYEMRAISWCQGVFSVVGARGYQMWGSDPIRWNTQLPDEQTRDQFSLQGIGCGPDGLVAVGQGGQIVISEDGRKWRLANGISVASLRHPTAIGETIVLPGHTWWGDGQLIARDSDGRISVEREFSAGAWMAAASNGARVLAGGEHNVSYEGGYGFIEYSDDLEDWLPSSSSPSGSFLPDIYDLAWDGQRFLSVGTGGSLGVSEFGEVWYFDQEFFDLGLASTSVASDGERVVSVGYRGRIGSSVAGEPWSIIDTGFDGVLWDVAHGGPGWVAVGEEGRVFFSSNGDEWESIDSGTQLHLAALEWFDDHFVATGEDGLTLISSDGREWTEFLAPAGVDLEGLTRFGSSLIAVGPWGRILQADCHETAESPRASFQVIPRTPVVGERVRLIDTSLGQAVSWYWDFGDGTSASGQMVEHVWDTPGAFTLRLDVENAAGVSSAAQTVEVVEYCVQPEAPIIDVDSTVLAGQPLEVSWNGVDADSYLVEVRDRPGDESGARLITWDVTDATNSVFDRTPDWSFLTEVFVRVRARLSCATFEGYSPWSDELAVTILPGRGQGSEYRYLVPAAANTEGLKNSSWRSELTLHNTSALIASGSVALLDGAESTEGSRLEIPSFGTVQLGDVMSSLSSQELAAGLIIGSEQPLVVGSRTYNLGQSGESYGQDMPGFDVETVEIVDQTAHLIGLVRNDEFRTNIGFVNAGPDPMSVTSTFFSKSGDWLAERTDEFGGQSFKQLTEVLESVGLDDIDGVVAEIRARNAIYPLAQGFSAYASIIDNQSGDPVTQIAPFESGSGFRDGNQSTWDHHLSGVLPDGTSWVDLVSHKGGWVVVGDGAIAYSHDGRTWETVVADQDSPFTAVSSNGDLVVAIGNGIAATSPDGQNWTVSDIEVPEIQYALMNDIAATRDGWIAGGGNWVSEGDRGILLRSSDGLSWELESTVVTEVTTVAVVGDSLFAAGQHLIAVKEGESDWQVYPYPSVWNFSDVATDGERVLCVSNQYETEGVVGRIDGGWQEIARIQPLSNVVWNGEAFVGVGEPNGDDDDYGFFVSADGVEWELIYKLDRRTAQYHALTNAADTVVGLAAANQLGWLLEEGRTLWIPAAAHTEGYAGTAWRSDLVLHNSSDERMRVRVDLLPRDEAPSEAQNVTFDIEKGASSVVADVLAEWFDFDGVAALRLAPDGPGLQAFSRLFNDSPEGSFGQAVPPFSRGDLIHPYEVGAIVGLRESGGLHGGYRTNLGLMSACEEPMVVQAEFRDGDGTIIGQLEQDLEPFDSVQVNRVLRQFSTTGIDSASVSLKTSTPGCAFAAYASIVDNLSGDPVFRRARRIPLTPSEMRDANITLDNRENALVLSELEGGVASTPMSDQAATIRAEVSGHFGAPHRRMSVVCSWIDTQGRSRAGVLVDRDTIPAVDARSPVLCFLPDRDQPANNVGVATLVIEGAGLTQELDLDAVLNAVQITAIDGSVVVQDVQFLYECSARGDLGSVFERPQVLALVTGSRGVDQARILRDGDQIRFPAMHNDIVMMVLDRDDANNNTGETILMTEYPKRNANFVQ